MPQLNLNFTDIPLPETHLWEQFDEDQKRVVIETTGLAVPAPIVFTLLSEPVEVNGLGQLWVDNQWKYKFRDLTYLRQRQAKERRDTETTRLVTADPYLPPLTRHQALVARIGFGVGEEVADGLWTEARELIATAHRQRRAKVLAPQARLAALLAGRLRPLACEELVLRARLDLDHGRPREAALQLLVALDAAIAELPGDAAAELLGERLDELRAERDRVADAAQAALEGALQEPELETVGFVLGRIEAALRARAVAGI